MMYTFNSSDDADVNATLVVVHKRQSDSSLQWSQLLSLPTCCVAKL